MPLIFDKLRNLEVLDISSLNSDSDIDMFEPHEVEANLERPKFDRNADISYLKNLKSFSFSGYGEFPGISLAKLTQLSELRDVEYGSYNQVE